MLKRYTDWFWSFFPPGMSEGSSSATQAILELVPIMLGVVVILGIAVFLSSRREVSEESEESEEVALTELDKEIEAIRKLQRERR